MSPGFKHSYSKLCASHSSAHALLHLSWHIKEHLTTFESHTSFTSTRRTPKQLISTLIFFYVIIKYSATSSRERKYIKTAVKV